MSENTADFPCWCSKNVRGFSKYQGYKYRNCQIPLSKRYCSTDSSAISKSILKWNQEKFAMTRKKQLEAEKKQKALNKKKGLNPLPSYFTATPSTMTTTSTTTPETEIIYHSSKYDFTRISPELYEMLQKHDKDHGLVKELKVRIGEPTQSRIGQLRSAEDRPQVPDWAHLNPNLYNYLNDVMNSGSDSNELYGIDFQNNFDSKEVEILKAFHPSIAMDVLRAMDIFQLLQSGATLTSEQLTFLAQFLRNFAHLGSEAFDVFLSLLDGAGLDNHLIGRYMQNLYKVMQHELLPDELRMVMTKLGPSADRDESPNRSGSLSPNRNNTEIPKSYRFQYDNKKSQKGSNSNEAPSTKYSNKASESKDLNKTSESKDLYKTSESKDLNKAFLINKNYASTKNPNDPNPNQRKLLKSPTLGYNEHAQTSMSKLEPFNPLWEPEVQNIQPKKILKVEEPDEPYDEIWEPRRLKRKRLWIPDEPPRLSDAPRRPSNSPEGIRYHTPWETTINWAEKPRFYRLTIGARRSSAAYYA